MLNIKRTFFLFHVFMMLSSNGMSQRVIEEYLIKSVYIYKICNFVEWPARKTETDPFVISILGKNPKNQKIEIPQDNKIKNRKVIVKEIDHVTQIKKSEVLFICASEADRIDSILDFVRSEEILTIGDTKGFGNKGVMINFYVKEEKLRFEINLEAVKNSPLEFHSQLYTIGKLINSINEK